MSVVKFPYSVSRRAYARRGRISKNGTPEERAAKAAVAPAGVIELSGRKTSKPAFPPLSGDELVAKMACLERDERRVIVDYMNLLLAKRST